MIGAVSAVAFARVICCRLAACPGPVVEPGVVCPEARRLAGEIFCPALPLLSIMEIVAAAVAFK